MTTKERPQKKKRSAPERAKPTELQKVRAWRQEQFVKVLKEAGLTDDAIDLNIVKTLVEGTVSDHDLKKLIEKGCDPETAIRILA